jgi:plastocyanin
MAKSLSDSVVARGVREGLAAAVVLASLATGQALAADAEVKIANFTFDPSTLTVSTTVTWVNADDIPHVVLEKNGKFRSPALDTDDKFSQTFSTTGTVEYFCAIHPHMTGKIVITP